MGAHLYEINDLKFFMNALKINVEKNMIPVDLLHVDRSGLPLNPVIVTIAHPYLKIFIDGTPHLIIECPLVSIHSYIDHINHLNCIEWTTRNSVIKTEYTDRELWVSILNQVNSAI